MMMVRSSVFVLLAFLSILSASSLVSAAHTSPFLRPYYPNTSYDPWMPNEFQSYIEDIDATNFTFRYWYDGSLGIFLNGKVFRPKYQQDDARWYRAANQTLPTDFNRASDFWLTPSFYMSHNYTGDCEDYALFMASVAKAKNLSHYVCLGWHRNVRHAWAEIQYNGTWHVMDVNYRPLPVGSHVSGGYTTIYRWNESYMWSRE